MQDIPASDILADGVLFDEKSTILLLAFLSSHLTNDERLVICCHFQIFPPCVKVLFRMHKSSSLIHIGSSKEFDQHEVGLQVCGD
jgi:hypothetical protein